MARFEATARISVNLAGLRRAARDSTQASAEMARAMRNLETSISRVEQLHRRLGDSVRRATNLYGTSATAARRYSDSLKLLSDRSQAAVRNVERLGRAMATIRGQSGTVSLLRPGDLERLNRVNASYQQLIRSISNLVTAQTGAQRSTRLTANQEAVLEERRRRRELQTRRVALEERRLEQQARNAALAEQRLAQESERLALAQERLERSLRGSVTGLNAMNSSMLSMDNALSVYASSLQRAVTLLESMVTGAFRVAAAHEQAFADVNRVLNLSGEALREFERGLITLSLELPTTFEETARVAQLLAQTGVHGSDSLLSLTRVVIEFSRVTGIASDQVALMFGRIREMADLPVSEVRNLASMVSLLGVSSASTEQEVLRLLEQVTTMGTQFGLSIQFIGGFASALASVRIRPELARGSVTRVFNTLNSAMEEGSEIAQQLGIIMGGTTDELRRLQDTDPDAFFLRFLEGLNRIQQAGGDVQKAIRALGINSVRDIDLLSRASGNLALVIDQVDKAFAGFDAGEETTRQAAIAFDTAQTALLRLKGALDVLIAELGGATLQVFRPFAEAVIAVVDGFNELPGGIKGALTALASLGVILAGLAAAFLAARVAALGMTRATRAIVQTQQQAGQSSTSFFQSLRDLNRALSGTEGRSLRAAAATDQVAAAQRRMQAANARVAAAQERVNQAQQQAGQSSRQYTAALQGASRAQTAASRASAEYRQAVEQQRQVLSNSNASFFERRRIIAESARSELTAARASRRSVEALRRQSAELRASRDQLQQTADRYQRLGEVSQRSAERLRQAGATAEGVARLNERAQRRLALASEASRAAAEANARSMQLSGQAARQAASGFTVMRAATRAAGASLATLRGGLAGLATTLVTVAIVGFVQSLMSARSAAEELGRSMASSVGGVQAFREALLEDTQRYRETGQAIDTITIGFGNLDKSQQDQIRSAQQAARAQDRINDALGESGRAASSASEGVRQYTDQLGEATDAFREMTLAIDEQVITKRIEVIRATLEELSKTQKESVLLFWERDLPAVLDRISPDRLEDFLETVRSLGTTLSGPDGVDKALGIVSERLNELGTLLLTPGVEAEIEAYQALWGALEGIEEAERGAALGAFALSDSLDQAAKDVENFTNNLGLSGAAAANLAANLATLTEDFRTGLAAFDAGPLDIWQRAVERANEAARREWEATRAEVEETGESFEDFVEVTSVSLDEWVAEFDRTFESIQNWSENLLKLSRELPADVVAQLAALGPQAAPLIEQLVGADAETRNKVIASLRLSSEEFQKSWAAEQAKLIEVLAERGQNLPDSLVAPINEFLLAMTTAGADVERILPGIADSIALASSRGREGILELRAALPSLSRSLEEASKRGVKDVEALGDMIATQLSQDVDIAVIMRTAEATQNIDRLVGYLETLQNDRRLDPEGHAQLSILEYLTQLGILEKTVEEGQEKFDITGEAELDDKVSEKLAELIALVQSPQTKEGLSTQGSFDVDVTPGEKSLDEAQEKSRETRGEFDKEVGPRSGLAIDEPAVDRFRNLMDRAGDIALRFVVRFEKVMEQLRLPSINLSGFQNQLNSAVSRARTAGASIQQALTRNATVSVGYRYYQVNQPPTTVRAASGGWINGPGGPTADRVPALLSSGEFVVNAKQARRFGALLEMVNSGRIGKGYRELLASAASAGASGHNRRMSPMSLSDGGDRAMFRALIQQIPSEIEFARRVSLPSQGGGPVFNITNQYPQAEPTSTTINRSLAYAATVSGV